jgi:hypothetical protein
LKKFLLLVIVLLPVLGGAPAASTPARTVRVPLRLQLGAGEPGPKDFRATLDRKKARIVRVLTPADPQMILVVLDLTADLSAFEPAKESLISAIEKLPPATYVGLLRAQDGLTVVTDPGPDRAPALDAIRNLAATGRPGLLETLESVERLADSIARKAQVRVAVLYVTDSDVREYREDFTNPVINSSDPHDLSRKFPETLIQEKFSKLLHNFEGRETPLHIVEVSYRTDRLNEAYQNGLKQLADSVTGTAEFCRSGAEIPEAIERAFAAISASYSVIVQVPDRASKNLQIQISAGEVPSVSRSRIVLKD